MAEGLLPGGTSLPDALLAQRVLVVAGELDDAASSSLAAALLTLDALGDDHVELRLTSCRGGLDAALSVVDVLGVLGVPVHAVALGTVEGGPVAILAAATERRIAPHAALRLRLPDVEVAGTAADLERALAAALARRDQLLAVLAGRCGRPFAELEAEWERGAFLEAPDAVALGYADEVSLGSRSRGPG